MKSIYLASAIGILTGIAWTFLPFGGWGWGTFIGMVAFVATFIIVARKYGKPIMSVINQSQRQAQAGNLALAVSTVESLIPVQDWIPMLKGQIQAMLGVYKLGLKKEDEAIAHLRQASNRAAEGKLFLASALYRKGEQQEAFTILEAAQRYNKKHVLLHNVHAWMRAKQKDVEGAMLQLRSLLKKVPENETSKDNLLRLQNGNKMAMKGFGMEWYALQLERPPANFGQDVPRKGFRQPPKRQKR